MSRLLSLLATLVGRLNDLEEVREEVRMLQAEMSELRWKIEELS